MEFRACRVAGNLEREKSQKTELQREKTPLRFLADSGVGHDSRELRGKHSWRAERTEQRFLQLLGIGDMNFLVQISPS